MSRVVAIALTFCVILCQGGKLRAGLYQKDVIADFDIDQDGNAVPLSYQSFMTALSIAGETDKLETAGSKAILQAIQERKKKGIEKLTPEETVAQSADLLRLRREESYRNEAMNLLQPLTRR